MTTATTDIHDHHDTTPENSGEGTAFLVAAILLAIWAGAIALFGFAGFFMVPVVLTPVCLLTLIIISRG